MWALKALLFVVATASSQEFGGQSDDPKLIITGDMVLTRQQHQWLFKNDTIKRHGLSSKAFRWPKGVVPVKISPDISLDFQNTIKAAADYISNGTCIKFEFNTENPKHLSIVRAPSGVCSAQVGYNRRVSLVMLDPDQCSKGNIIHELLHVLGFYHMHTANDRDNFIEINFENIKADRRNQFEKIVREVSMFNTSYDFESIMHYADTAFAINKSIPVITTKGSRRSAPEMGQRRIMTPGDFLRVNRMYGCDLV